MPPPQDITSAIAKTFGLAEEEKMAARKKLAEETLPAKFDMLEKLIVANGDTGWVVSNQMTIADLCIWRLMGWAASGKFLDGVPATVADKSPKLKKLVHNVDTHPKVQEWKQKFPDKYGLTPKDGAKKKKAAIERKATFTDAKPKAG